jgi:hypothetical protein
VALPRERSLQACVLEHQRHLLREARQEDHLRLGEAAAGAVGQDEAPHRGADGQDWDGGQRAQTLARDHLAGRCVQLERALATDVGGAEGPALTQGTFAEGDLRGDHPVGR